MLKSASSSVKELVLIFYFRQKWITNYACIKREKRMNLPEKWLACQQNVNDRIRFIEHSNPEEIASLPYYKFFDFITKTVAIQRFDDFRSHIDRFKKILLDLETGEWIEHRTQVDTSELTFENLVELNREKEDERDTRGQRVVDMLWEKGRGKGKVGGRVFK